MDFALNLQGLRTDETADAGSLSSALSIVCCTHAAEEVARQATDTVTPTEPPEA